MPVVTSRYQPKGLFKNGHISTIYAAKLRRVRGVSQYRERMDLDDGDFIDVDWSFSQSEKKSTRVVVAFHGLEGNAQRPYMLGLAKILNENFYDCATVNLRGCSGVPNNSFRSYHSGATDYAAAVINHIAQTKNYDQIFLSGFSLGGNLILKYLGEERTKPENLVAASAISVPVNLHDSLKRLNTYENWVYRTTFLKSLRKKYKAKIRDHNQELNWQNYHQIKSLQAFDDLYTAPAHGFKNALDYYRKSSSLQYLPHIKIPTLLLNARNDSFLDESCFPIVYAQKNKNLYLEIPENGGHVGFVQKKPFYYSEQRTLKFFEEKH